ATDRQAEAEQDEKAASNLRHGSPSSGVALEEFAQLACSDRQDEAPHSAGRNKRQSEDNECRNFGGAGGLNELRHERKEEQGDFRIENVRENSVAKRTQSATATAPARLDCVRNHEHS